MIMKLCIGESPFCSMDFPGPPHRRELGSNPSGKVPSAYYNKQNKFQAYFFQFFFFFIYRIIAPNYELVEKGFKSSKALCKKRGCLVG